ncbi:MAG: hypothetical protein ABUL60_36695 [Myxococcales bacterium]
MSLSTDVLAKATPTRLLCRGGRWVLELTRLEAVDRDVFQPRLTRLEGSESILALLRRSEEGQLLASGAAQLMRSPRTEEDRAFEVNEGDWVPASDAGPSPRREQPADAEGGDLGRAVLELRAELAVLRASHARLRDRVIALEATQSGIAQPNLRPPRGSRSQRRRSEPPPGFTAAEPVADRLGAQQENPGFAATQASPALGAATPAPVVTPSAAVSSEPPVASLEDMARAIAGDQPPPVLALPALRSLTECLQTLLEAPPPLEVQAKPTPLESLTGALACKLLDDEGRERGAIILDLRAALLLGAGLLAVPRDEALRQLNDNEPSEDALLATSEICNNLTGPVNATSGNDHVRSTALTSVDVSTLPKLRARLDLMVDGGKVVLGMF